MTFCTFSSHQPIDVACLPLTLISLEDWALSTFTGADSKKYLQDQLTVDVNQITEYQHLLAAHCNPNGKMLSNLRLFHRQDGFAIIERRNLRDAHLFELKKYAVFSKVNIAADDKHVMLGVAGLNARSALKNIFSSLPDATMPVINFGATSLLWFKYPAERFLIVADVSTSNLIKKALYKEALLKNSQQWLALNIEAGEPVIDAANSGKFIPQAINLQVLGGISFKKGCYMGQEAVARAKFRGANKRALWYLAGYASRVPKAGEYLEQKIGENWRRIGTVLAAVELYNGRLLVQAIMNKDVEENSIFRVYSDTNTLKIKPLPYSLLIQ